jgi:integrase
LAGHGKLDSYTKNWLNEYSQERQRQRRLRALRRFQQWLQDTYRMDPGTLLTEAKRGSRGPKKVDQVLRKYHKFLIDKKRNAKSSAGQWYALLRSFFTVNGVDLGKYPRKIGVQSVYEKSRVPSQDNVKEMLQTRSSSRDRFVVAFFAQTGQRIGVLTALKRKMITMTPSGHGLVKVPPTLQNARGENMNESGLPYTFVIGLDSMRLLSELPTYEGGWLLDISQRQMARIVDEAARAVRIQHKDPTDIGRSWSTVHPNTFRNYWRNRMTEAGSDQRLVLHMMGYRVPTILGSFDRTDQQLLKAYQNAESKLELL